MLWNRQTVGQYTYLFTFTLHRKLQFNSLLNKINTYLSHKLFCHFDYSSPILHVYSLFLNILIIYITVMHKSLYNSQKKKESSRRIVQRQLFVSVTLWRECFSVMIKVQFVWFLLFLEDLNFLIWNTEKRSSFWEMNIIVHQHIVLLFYRILLE